MKDADKKQKGRVLKPGFTKKLFMELLEGLRTKKKLMSYLNEDLGIGWRNLSLKCIRDIPLSILMKIILNYAYQWDRKSFVKAGERLAARIYDYADKHLDEFNNPNTDDPEED